MLKTLCYYFTIPAILYNREHEHLNDRATWLMINEALLFSILKQYFRIRYIQTSQTGKGNYCMLQPMGYRLPLNYVVCSLSRNNAFKKWISPFDLHYYRQPSAWNHGRRSQMSSATCWWATECLLCRLLIKETIKEAWSRYHPLISVLQAVTELW